MMDSYVSRIPHYNEYNSINEYQFVSYFCHIVHVHADCYYYLVTLYVFLDTVTAPVSYCVVSRVVLWQ